MFLKVFSFLRFFFVFGSLGFWCFERFFFEGFFVFGSLGFWCF